MSTAVESRTLAAQSTGTPDDVPVVLYTILDQVKKGEDFSLAIPKYKHGSLELGIYCVFDGHNGTAAAVYAKDTLIDTIFKHVGAIESQGDEAASELISRLPNAMAEGFLECHTQFAKRGDPSGTTATVSVICGWTITVAAVGDSRAILQTIAGGVQDMTVDHRFEVSKEERQRVLQEGGQIGRLRDSDGDSTGPLRSWPGGLCVSRSIGDVDCGPQITPLPHVRQVEIPRQGGRLVMASDGLWDAVYSDDAAKVSSGLHRDKAASSLIKESIRNKGLRDDITVVVVDMFSASSLSSSGEIPIPKLKAKSSSIWKKIKVLKYVKRNGSKEKAVMEALGSSEDNLPNLVNDHDSIKGGNLYERYMKEGSIHTKGAFCKVCGEAVEGAGFKETETSVRAGNFYCSKHVPDGGIAK